MSDAIAAVEAALIPFADENFHPACMSDNLCNACTLAVTAKVLVDQAALYRLESTVSTVAMMARFRWDTVYQNDRPWQAITDEMRAEHTAEAAEYLQFMGKGRPEGGANND